MMVDSGAEMAKPRSNNRGSQKYFFCIRIMQIYVSLNLKLQLN